VTFNKINTHEWYRQRIYHLEPEYNPEDRTEAFRRSLEWGDPSLSGYSSETTVPPMKRMPIIENRPLVRQPFDISKIEATLKEFH
jgi:2-oxoglutarate ferredoxin oxidoreductase subunit beta